MYAKQEQWKAGGKLVEILNTASKFAIAEVRQVLVTVEPARIHCGPPRGAEAGQEQAFRFRNF